MVTEQVSQEYNPSPVFNYEVTFFYLKMYEMGFPDGSVVKNLPANAGDTGSIPGLRRALMPWSN